VKASGDTPNREGEDIGVADRENPYQQVKEKTLDTKDDRFQHGSGVAQISQLASQLVSEPANQLEPIYKAATQICSSS
jgi:hypothetical protein